jgi:hypothetical protein
MAVVVMTSVTSLVWAQSFTGSVVSADSGLPIGAQYQRKESEDFNEQR